VAGAAPDAIVHLAGQAFVPLSVVDPLGTLAVNATGTAHVLEAARAVRARVLVVSSAEVYGIQRPERMPLDETAVLRPGNAYAASKVAAETYALAWHRSYGLDVVVARPFNHIGPGQDERFVVASFARQLADIAGGAPPLLRVGNLEAQRDFLDVRDVAAAYVLLLANGRAGEVYNICSGRPVAIREVLRQLITIARVPVEIRDDPERMRSSDCRSSAATQRSCALRPAGSRSIRWPHRCATSTRRQARERIDGHRRVHLCAARRIARRACRRPCGVRKTQCVFDRGRIAAGVCR